MNNKKGTKSVNYYKDENGFLTEFPRFITIRFRRNNSSSGAIVRFLGLIERFYDE